MSRKLKKLTHKYEFLKLELEELEEQSEEYTLEWSKLFGKFFIDKNQEMWVNEETGEVRKDPPTDDEEEEFTQKEKKPEKVKKLYRKLSTVIHPDKGGTAEDFSLLKEYYEENNLLELLKFASDYNINYELDEEDELMIEGSCSKVDEKINNTKATLSWLYFTGDKNKKLHIIKVVENELGIKIPPEEYPEELRD